MEMLEGQSCKHGTAACRAALRLLCRQVPTGLACQACMSWHQHLRNGSAACRNIFPIWALGLYRESVLQNGVQ